MILYTHLESPLGELLATGSGETLTGLYFSDQAHVPEMDRGWVREDEAEIFTELARQLEAYCAGARKNFDLPWQTAGTDFQRRVWDEISRIPFGRTLSYGELARRVGSPAAVRAVGAAAGRNPVCWIVPCHRVTGKDGALTGYAGGLPRKRALLDFESGRIDSLAREPQGELLGV